MLRVITGRALQQHQLGQGCTGLTDFACRLPCLHLGHQGTGIGPALLQGRLFTVVVPALKLGAQRHVFWLLPVLHARFEGRAVVFVAALSVQGGGAVARVRVTGAYITRRFDWYSQITAFALDSPRNVARCYFAYGLTVRNAMRNLAQGAQVRETPLKEKVVLVRGDLQERAATALVAALRAPGLMDEINRNTITVTSDDCMLPTVFGLMGGNKGWQCGPLNVDPNQVQANLGNLAVLAENQFMGQRLTFAQVAGQSTSARSTDSRSTYSSADNSNESGQDVSMAKRRSSSRDQSATTGSSGKADTNASPK